MEFSGTNSANIPGGSHPSKKKQSYIRPQATVITPDQAQEQVKAKAAPQSQEFEACSELIADARKRQEHGQDSVSQGEDKFHRADVAGS